MFAIVNRFLVKVSLIFIAVGCAPTSKVISVKSSGVEQIPLKVAIYPLLSSAKPDYHGEVRALSSAGNVVIAPPAETQLSITQDSQIMTGLISTQLAAHGFALKELPVEITESETSASSNEVKNAFAISMDLLNQLRENYGIQTLVIGNAFFVNQHLGTSFLGKRVIFAHIKIIDIKSLDVLAQVSLPYNMDGVELNEAAEQISNALARLAGINGP